MVSLTQSRTPDQVASARFWDSPAGTHTPIGVWDSITAGYVTQFRLNEAAAAKVFAHVQATMFDALIACWDSKYHYWYIRPSQVNSAISLAFPVPNFPAYPSGHSCVSAAAGKVLSYYFPSRAGDINNLVSEAGLSRIVAGIHYRFDVTEGQELGRRVADWSIRRSGL